jgi:hypothetical protein
MSNTAAQTWQTASLRSTETASKISEAGIYSRLILSKIEEDKDKFKYTFTFPDETYTDIAIFYEPNPTLTWTTVDKQQIQCLEKLVAIADAVGTAAEVDRIPKPSYMVYAKAMHKYIESKKGCKVNIKLLLDKDQNYVNMASFNFIERHVDGFDPKLKFTTWEINNNRTKRTIPRPKIEPKTTGSSFSDSAPSPAESADFSSFLSDAVIETLSLPF